MTHSDAPKQADRVSQSEAGEMIAVSRAMLRKFDASGELKPVRSGGRVWYLREDVVALKARRDSSRADKAFARDVARQDDELAESREDRESRVSLDLVMARSRRSREQESREAEDRRAFQQVSDRLGRRLTAFAADLRHSQAPPPVVTSTWGDHAPIIFSAAVVGAVCWAGRVQRTVPENGSIQRLLDIVATLPDEGGWLTAEQVDEITQ